MSCLCERCSFWQTAGTRGTVTDKFTSANWRLRHVLTDVFVLQGRWHAGHGTHASGEFPLGVPDYSHSRAGGHWAHLASSHQELLCGWTRPQTSLRGIGGKRAATCKSWREHEGRRGSRGRDASAISSVCGPTFATNREDSKTVSGSLLHSKQWWVSTKKPCVTGSYTVTANL